VTQSGGSCDTTRATRPPSLSVLAAAHSSRGKTQAGRAAYRRDQPPPLLLSAILPARRGTARRRERKSTRPCATRHDRPGFIASPQTSDRLVRLPAARNKPFALVELEKRDIVVHCASGEPLDREASIALHRSHGASRSRRMIALKDVEMYIATERDRVARLCAPCDGSCKLCTVII